MIQQNLLNLQFGFTQIVCKGEFMCPGLGQVKLLTAYIYFQNIIISFNNLNNVNSKKKTIQ